MNRFLNMDNPFFRFMGKVGDVFLLNMMWLVLSLPVLTMGAATTAAFNVGMRLARGEDGSVVSRFLKSFRMNFKQATCLHVIYLIVGLVLGMDMLLWLKAKGSLAGVMVGVSTALLLLYAILVLYSYAVLARFENTLTQTVKNAALMAIANMPITILMVAGLLIYIVVNSMAMLFNILTLCIGLGLFAYLYGILFNVAFRKLIPKEHREEENLSVLTEQEEVPSESVDKKAN